jgi:hypothetical protein
MIGDRVRSLVTTATGTVVGEPWTDGQGVERVAVRWDAPHTNNGLPAQPNVCVENITAFQAECYECGGLGYNNDEDQEACEECGGTGMVTR